MQHCDARGFLPCSAGLRQQLEESAAQLQQKAALLEGTQSELEGAESDLTYFRSSLEQKEAYIAGELTDNATPANDGRGARPGAYKAAELSS